MRIGQRVMLIAPLESLGFHTPPIGSVGEISGLDDGDYLVMFDDWLDPVLGVELAELCPRRSIVPIDEAKEDHSQLATIDAD
jgi:hypothetical protein